MPKLNLKSTLFFLLAVVLAFITALVLTGVFTAVSANVTISSLEVFFDPQITIAYMLVAYFLSHYFALSSRQSFWTFLTALLLSYVVIFMQGSIFLIFVLIFLRKFGFLSSQE